MAGSRTAEVKRKTKETEVRVRIDLDGGSATKIATGVGFFDHMLNALSCHGRLGLTVEGKGDLHVDQHHLVEDVGIALGSALREALGGDLRIRRFGSAYAPLDESLARAVIDVSGRAYLHFGVQVSRSLIGDFSSDLVEEFFQSFTANAKLNLHVDLVHGKNAHHQVESVFKATALALRQALAVDSGLSAVPSTKGALSEEEARQ